MSRTSFSREFKMETLVGTFVVMIFLGVAYFTIILSRTTWLAEEYPIEVVFSNVTSLSEGDTVVVRGMPVGQVDSLTLEDDGVHVMAVLDQEIPLYDDYKVTILANSMLGGRRMEIAAGTPMHQPVPPGEVLRGEDPTDLVADASEMISEVKEAMTSGGIVSNLQSVSSNLNAITTEIRSGQGTLGKLIFARDSAYDDLSATASSLRSVVEGIEKGEGTIGRLVKDEKVYDDLSATASSLRNVVEGIEKGEGTIGRLVKDDEVYDRVVRTMEDVQATLDEYRETAPVVTFSSVFFGAL